MTNVLRPIHLGAEAEPKVHPVVAATARELLNRSENERSGVRKAHDVFRSVVAQIVVLEAPREDALRREQAGRLDFLPSPIEPNRTSSPIGFGARATPN